MPSLRAKLVNRYIRSTLKRLPLHEMAPEEVRRAFERKLPVPLPKGVTCESVDGPVRGEWHRRAEGGGDHVILYMHGGGYVFGTPALYRNVTFGLAKMAGADVFSLAYRRAPEDPCPAALDDALAAYQWLRAQGHEPSRISFMGDSAGGGLALATMQALAGAGEVLPASAVLFSPLTDLAVEGASAVANAERDPMFRKRSIELGAIHYAGALDVKDPRASPLYGDMRGLPPLLIYASTSEILYDDSTRLVRRAEEEGVEVSFISHDGLVHVWPVFYPLMPEAKMALDESAAFIRNHLR